MYFPEWEFWYFDANSTDLSSQGLTTSRQWSRKWLDAYRGQSMTKLGVNRPQRVLNSIGQGGTVGASLWVALFRWSKESAIVDTGRAKIVLIRVNVVLSQHSRGKPPRNSFHPKLSIGNVHLPIHFHACSVNTFSLSPRLQIHFPGDGMLWCWIYIHIREIFFCTILNHGSSSENILARSMLRGKVVDYSSLRDQF